MKSAALDLWSLATKGTQEFATAFRWAVQWASAPLFVLHLSFFILLFYSCSPTNHDAADELNTISYTYHYRSLDSTEHYARRAYTLAEGYDDGQGEALNNLAFVSTIRMQYELAQRQLDSVFSVTDNEIELLIASLQQMRICQRRSNNRAFYDYRERAVRALKRIDEERDQLNAHQQRRMLYAEAELAIINSTYYYYVGLERQSIEALDAIPQNIEADTAQWLNYLYNVGAGGIITQGTQADINQQEFDCLVRCFQIASIHHYPYFIANALEALSEHLQIAAYREQLLTDNGAAVKLINPEGISDTELPISLASRSLSLFQSYGDVYQIAGAYRTLAACYRAIGDYPSALFNLEQSLADSTILQAPDLVASIREQLSVAYAAINDKPASDHNRNLYLDLQEQTRQDRSLEARAGQLDQTVAQLNRLLWAVIGAIALLVFLLWLFVHLHRRNQKTDQMDSLLVPLRDWETSNQQASHDLEEQNEELHERLAIGQLHLEDGQRLNVEQRAKVSLVNSITPFIDRILHEVKRLDTHPANEATLDYIRELTDKINEQNDVLTHWIQLRQGELSLHIETFALQPLFDLMARSKASFAMKGVDLSVQPTTAHVKADRVLTLFMLNTLADNACKFTPAGGHVSVSAEETPQYIEISVSDTGEGMDTEQLAHVFERKIIVDQPQHASASTQSDAARPRSSHGFGLLNCRGIIEKYRKVSQIFSVCLLSAESQKGRGSRFFFRLPKGVARLLLVLLLPLAATVHASDQLSQAKAYADSAYFSNIKGTYLRTLLYIDSCRHCLNEHYRQQVPAGTDTMTLIGDPSVMAHEISWYHDSLKTNYGIILDMRNEAAVAALAMHEWELYAYNNRIYTQLFKETSADSSLDDYCRTMQQSSTNKTIAIALLVLVLIAILPAYYFLYYRHRLYYRFCVERVKTINDILLAPLSDEQKLARIRPLASERFPQQLQGVVSKIEQALQLSIASRQQQEEDIELTKDELRRTELEEAALHVSNAVLDNCLSTLKHETMYYPSRIRQLVDRNDTSSLPEVVGYYRELYGLLSMQAMRQTERHRLHLEPLDHELFADRVLLRYLFDILRKQSGQKQLAADYQPYDRHFVEIRIAMPSLRLSADEAAHLFEPREGQTPYLICRQIVREHGEAIHRTDFGIRAESQPDGAVTIIMKLPRHSHRLSAL